MKLVMQQAPKVQDEGGCRGGDAASATALPPPRVRLLPTAASALTDPELSDPEAVHEVRKAPQALACAACGLLARPLGEQADQMRSEARELMRAYRRRPRCSIGARCA